MRAALVPDQAACIRSREAVLQAPVRALRPLGAAVGLDARRSTRVIGNPLTMIAGVLREAMLPFVLIVAIAKTARYAVIAALLTL